MTIKKFQGKTKEEAIDKAKAELGSQVVIMNVKEVRPGGFFGFFKRSSYEVTAAIEDDVLARPSYRQISKTMGEGNNFSAVADESIAIKPVSYNESMAASPKKTVEDSAKKRTVPTNDAMISKEPLLEKKELQEEAVQMSVT